MAKEILQGWFGLNIEGDEYTAHICHANDVEDAKSIFGSLCKFGEIHQLTWGELSVLTGCVMPAISTEDDLAFGMLCLRRHDRLIKIWQRL
jgi:hypothetical protein